MKMNHEIEIEKIRGFLYCPACHHILDQPRIIEVRDDIPQIRCDKCGADKSIHLYLQQLEPFETRYRVCQTCQKWGQHRLYITYQQLNEEPYTTANWSIHPKNRVINTYVHLVGDGTVHVYKELYDQVLVRPLSEWFEAQKQETTRP